jgi:EpsI family protein
MKRFIVVTVILALTAMGHLSILSAQDVAAGQRPPDARITIPAYIGNYHQVGEDIDVGDDIRSFLQTSDILIRNYAGPSGWPVQLTLVHAGVTRRSLHFPEVCLVGQGWEVREQTTIPIGVLFNARKLVLVKGTAREAVLYWFKTGDQLTGNYFVNAWYWAYNQLTLGAPTSTMIKISTPVGPAGEEAALALLQDYAMRLEPVLMERVP